MARRLALPVLAFLLIGCESREVEKDLKIVEVRTGWFDLGVVGGMNKLVPSISLDSRMCRLATLRACS